MQASVMQCEIEYAAKEREGEAMKRNKINQALKEMERMVEKYHFALPPFCFFTPEELQEKGHDYDEVRDNI